jgi:hypothetical protein
MIVRVKSFPASRRYIEDKKLGRSTTVRERLFERLE